MKKKDIVQAVPQSIRIPILKNISTLTHTEGPVSLLCSPKEDWQTFIVSELLPCLTTASHPNELLYFNPADREKQTLLNSFSNLFNSRFGNQTNMIFNSHDPTDWSIALRSIFHSGFKEPYSLVIDNLDSILESPRNEQHQFTSLITHIACEPNLNVFVVINRSNLETISQLNGFRHLHAQLEAFSMVPQDWQPPRISHPPTKETETKRKKPTALSSNLFLSSAVIISMATLSAAFWVANSSSQLPRIAARNKTILPENKAAMRSINVASAKTIEWGRPSADRQTMNQEIMRNPIPVAFPRQYVETPEIRGQLAELINIEAVDAYHDQVFKKLNTKSILSIQTIPNDEAFFASDAAEPSSEQNPQH